MNILCLLLLMTVGTISAGDHRVRQPIAMFNDFTDEDTIDEHQCYLDYLDCTSSPSIVRPKRPRHRSYSCPIMFCTLEYFPVCGKNVATNGLMTFGNRCAFDRTNCNSEIKYEFVKQGEC